MPFFETIKQSLSVLVHTVTALLALVVAFVMWGELRGAAPLSLIQPSATTLSLPLTAFNPNRTAIVNVTAATMRTACVTACGTTGSLCGNQSTTTGVVGYCVACGADRVGAVPPGCVAPAQGCQLSPWCLHTQSLTARRLNLALVQASLDYAKGNVNNLPDPYPNSAAGIGNMTHSSNWTTVIVPLGINAVDAIALLNLWTDGKVARLAVGDRAANPADWFDDQLGWWNTSALSVWEASRPLDFAPYIHALKARVCTTYTWLAAQGSSSCSAPLV